MTNPLTTLLTEMAAELDYSQQRLMDNRKATHPLADRARVLLDKHEPQPPADGEAAELVAELRHFVAEYQQVRGLDPENIYSIQQGNPEKEAHLRISRLTCVADLLEHPQPVAHVDVGIEWMPCVKLPITVLVRDQRPGETHSITRNGITPLRSDDLIMRGIQGEEYPIGRELFEQTYKLLPTPETTNG